MESNPSWLQGPREDDSALDVNALRAWVQKMTDAQLLAFGKAARYMCSPKANMGKPPRDVFVIQLNEARAEWRRRNPKKCQRQMIKLCSREGRLREQIAKCSRRAAQKIAARFKAGKPSTDAIAKLIEQELGELNP